MRILVVEDYSPIRESIVKGLREQDFAVDEADNGTDGLWHAQSLEYDVIILDLMLPGIPGLEILKTIRQKRLDTCVLILTARDQVDDRVAGLDAGADDYLVKPFAFAELLAASRRCCAASTIPEIPCCRWSDLEIDTATRTVRRSGHRIELTAREYVLLEYLAARAGEVVTRTDIWAHVYDFQDDQQSNVVDVYISYLRKKIEVDGLPRLIHTRRGHGYVLGELK